MDWEKKPQHADAEKFYIRLSFGAVLARWAALFLSAICFRLNFVSNFFLVTVTSNWLLYSNKRTT